MTLRTGLVIEVTRKERFLCISAELGLGEGGKTRGSRRTPVTPCFITSVHHPSGRPESDEQLAAEFDRPAGQPFMVSDLLPLFALAIDLLSSLGIVTLHHLYICDTHSEAVRERRTQ